MIKELVKSSRSYRNFDSSYEMKLETLHELVDIARFCPSSVNRQPLKYYCISAKEEVGKLMPLLGFAKALKDRKLPDKGKEPNGFIIICHDLTIASSNSSIDKDVGIVAQSILLGACEMGLGGCCIGSFVPDAVREKLELDKRYLPKLVIALGKVAETVVLEDVGEDGDISYYRDEDDVHHVPKRKLIDLLIR